MEPANDLVGGAQGVALTDLSVSTDPVGTAALSYNNTTGVFTYTPPDLSGYLTSYTETDPVFTASAAAGITAAKINQWDTSYSWGNHANGGYLTAEADTLDTVTSRGATTSNDITLNGATLNLSGSTSNLYIGQTSNRIEMSHNTSNGNLTCTTGYMYIRGASGLRVQKEGTGFDDIIIANSDGAVELFYDDAKKLETTSTGVTITGSTDINIGTEQLSIFGLGNEAYVRNLNGTGGGGAVNIQGRSGSYLWTGGSYVGVASKSTGEGALYYQSAEKLTATTTGVTITGDLNFTGDLRQNGSLFFPIANATISDTAPGSPTAGDLWWESDKGRLKIYYNDTDSSQWVDASPPLAQPNVPVAAGYITLNGTSPTWSGTTGYTVTGAQPGGGGTDYEITLTFPTAYSARTDYIVQVTFDGTNYVAQNGAQIAVARGTASVVFTPRRWDEQPLGTGEIMVTITNL